MARFTVYLPEHIFELTKELPPEVSLSSLLAAKVVETVECDHASVVTRCARCGKPMAGPPVESAHT